MNNSLISPCQADLRSGDKYHEQKLQMTVASPKRTHIGDLPSEGTHASRTESKNSPWVHSQYTSSQKADVHTEKMSAARHYCADHDRDRRHAGDDDQCDQMYDSFGGLQAWLRIIIVSNFRVDEIRERRKTIERKIGFRFCHQQKLRTNIHRLW